MNIETRDGREVLRILEFDTKAQAWTGRSWFYPLEANGNAIGDFNMIDASTGLIIERDNGEGTADKACPDGKKGESCFHDIARFKRIVKIELSDAKGEVVKVQDCGDPAKDRMVTAKDFEYGILRTLDPATAVIAPGTVTELRVWAYPKTAADYTDRVIICTKDNPASSSGVP